MVYKCSCGLVDECLAITCRLTGSSFQTGSGVVYEEDFGQDSPRLLPRHHKTQDEFLVCDALTKSRSLKHGQCIENECCSTE